MQTDDGWSAVLVDVPLYSFDGTVSYRFFLVKRSGRRPLAGRLKNTRFFAKYLSMDYECF